VDEIPRFGMYARNDDDEDQHGAMLWLGFRKAEVKELELRDRKYEEHSLCTRYGHAVPTR
jgi:hypothetical protein